MMDSQVVVLGGGITGLVASILAVDLMPRTQVLLIESSRQLGGALAGFKTLGEKFDLGTHIPQQLGNAVIDEIIESAIKPEQLQRFSSKQGDRAGTIQGGRVYSDSSYLDVLDTKPDLARCVIAHVLSTSDGKNSFSSAEIRRSSARTVSSAWFGDEASEQLVMPLLAHWFGDNTQLSGFALQLANLTRLRAADHEEWLKHSGLSEFRNRIAFPHQSDLPIALQHGRQSLYPRNGDASLFVLGLAARAREKGVVIKTGVKVHKVDARNKSIEIVENESVSRVPYRQLISTVGPVTTLKLVDHNVRFEIERVQLRLVHHRVDPVVDSDLCYAYATGLDSRVFRVTNYRGFSGKPSDNRLTTELFLGGSMGDSELIGHAEEFLRRSGLLHSGARITSSVSPPLGGYPSPTVATFEKFGMAAELLSTYEGNDLIIAGVGSGGTAFFQNEILAHLYEQLF